MKRIFAIMFPAGPAINSLLATAYISGPPSELPTASQSISYLRPLTN